MSERRLIIIPVYNNAEFIKNFADTLEYIDNADVLILDDNSSDQTFEITKKYKKWMKYIKHESSLGYGASFITGYEYARDFGYDIVVFLDPSTSNIMEDISELLKNIDYGFDIVSSSRILENYNYLNINSEKIKIISQISDKIKEITEYNITDPLSGILAFKVKSLKDMEFTEFDHGIHLQIWIQAAYFGLEVIEIPAESGSNFGVELDQYEDPLGLFLSVMETERHLYKKGSIN